MKCPKCHYIHGYHVESTDTSFKTENIEGKHGDFFVLPIELEQSRDYYPHIVKAGVYGCPACKIVFMGE